MGGGGIYLKSIIYIYILVILIIYIFHIYLYILFYYYTTTNYWRYIPFFLSLNTIRCIGFSPVSPRRLGLSLPHGIVACVRGPFVRNQGSGWWFFSEKSQPYMLHRAGMFNLDLLPISSMYGILNLHFGMLHTVDGSEIWLTS